MVCQSVTPVHTTVSLHQLRFCLDGTVATIHCPTVDPWSICWRNHSVCEAPREMNLYYVRAPRFRWPHARLIFYTSTHHGKAPLGVGTAIKSELRIPKYHMLIGRYSAAGSSVHVQFAYCCRLKVAPARRR
jgi:hypothetical protein